MISKNNIRLILFSIFVIISSFFLCDITEAKNFTINKTGFSTSYSADKNIYGIGMAYSYYQYTAYDDNGNQIPAFCLDAHLPYGGNGTFAPALEDSHTQNLYEKYISAADGSEDKIMAQRFIRIGQEIADNPGEYDGVEGEVAQQIALRKVWYDNISYKLSKGYSYSGGGSYYDAFTSENLYLTGKAGKLYYDIALPDQYPTNENDSGFTYENGFWEAQYKFREGAYEKGLTGNAEDGYDFHALYETNIRPEGLSCDNISYDSEIFECGITAESDPLDSNKQIGVIRIKSKVKLTDTSFQFYVQYTDPREASNFWVLYKWLSNGYNNTQRMFVIDNISGNFTITVGEPPSETPPDNDICEPTITNDNCGTVDNYIKDGSTYSFWVGTPNINQCVLEKLDRDTYSSDNSTKYSSYKNDYCKIATAEDYKITVPTGKSAKAGTYFEFLYNEGTSLDGNEISIYGRKITSARVNLEKFYKLIYGNSSGNMPDNYYTLNNGRPALNYTKWSPYVVDAADSYTGNGGLYQEAKDYEWLRNYLSNHANSGNYYTEESDRCKNSNVFGCIEYWNNYIHISRDTTIYEEHWRPTIEIIRSAADDANYQLTKVKELIKNAVDRVNICTDKIMSMTVTASLNPKINYDYFDKTYGKDISIVENSTIDYDNSAIYCEDNLNYSDNKYSCINGETSTPSKKKLFEIDGTSYKMYIYKQSSKFDEVTKTYKTSPIFYSLAQTGGVTTNSSASNSTLLGNVIPVSLNSPSGPHEYKFYFTNIGTYMKNEKFDYTCYYDVSKKITCSGENCQEDTPNFFYRNVSLNNLQPNSRNYGYNWTDPKGQKTLCLISGGQWIGEDDETGSCSIPDDSTPEKIYNEPEYSFTLTPDNMKAIKKYNQDQENVDLSDSVTGYGNFNMTQSSITDKDSNKVWYTSNFLREQNDCENCFTVNKIPSTDEIWTIWTGDYAKLSGTGPAWK